MPWTDDALGGRCCWAAGVLLAMLADADRAVRGRRRGAWAGSEHAQDARRCVDGQPKRREPRVGATRGRSSGLAAARPRRMAVVMRGGALRSGMYGRSKTKEKGLDEWHEGRPRGGGLPVADAAAAAGEWYEDGCADDDAGGQKGNSTTFGEDGEKETTTLAKRRRWAKMANEAAQASRYLYCLVDKATGDSRVQQRCAGAGSR